MKKKTPKKSFKHFGEMAKRKRLEFKLTQQALADDLGVHSQFCSNWERGLCAVPEHSIRKFIARVGVTKTDFISALKDDHDDFVKEYTRWVYNK